MFLRVYGLPKNSSAMNLLRSLWWLRESPFARRPMKKMIVQRLLHLVVVLFLVTLVSFFLMYFLPAIQLRRFCRAAARCPNPDVVAQKGQSSAWTGLWREQYVAWLTGGISREFGNIDQLRAARCIRKSLRACQQRCSWPLSLSCAHACGVHSSWLFVRPEEEPRN